MLKIILFAVFILISLGFSHFVSSIEYHFSHLVFPLNIYIQWVYILFQLTKSIFNGFNFG